MNVRRAARIFAAIASATFAGAWAVPRIIGVSINDIAATAAVMAFVLSPTFHFLKGEVAKDRKIKSMHHSICAELDDTVDALDRKKYKNDAVSFHIHDGTVVYFMNRYLNHDIYDSVLSSGDISLIRSGSQQNLQNTYSLIKDHNKRLDQIREITARKKEAYPEEADHIYVALEKCERQLLKMIPKIKEELGAPAPSRRRRQA